MRKKRSNHQVHQVRRKSFLIKAVTKIFVLAFLVPLVVKEVAL